MLSIAVKLPLALALLLSAAFGTMTVAVYLEMRASVLSIASQRLEHAARQMADVFATSIRQRLNSVHGLAQQPAMGAFLAATATAEEKPVRDALSRYVGASTPSASVELWNAEGRRLMTAGASFSELPAPQVRDILSSAGQAARPVLSPYRREGSALEYTASAAVRHNGTVAGFVVDRRRLAGTAQAATLLTGLIGERARMLIGNGGAWSDLSTAVEPPPLTAESSMELMAYQRGGESVIARSVPIPDTPWTVLIELPRELVVAPADRLLSRALTLAVLVVLIASGVGWLLSRRLTTPLLRVTAAAEAIAEERPVARLTLSRSDEIGRLATSFNTMADRVEDSRHRFESLVHDLERRVNERTAALRAANSELEAFSYSVSHDLRAPLRAIAGFSSILAEDHADRLPPDGRESLQVIERNVRHMGQLIDDLLTFSRLGRQPLTRATIDMTALAQTVADDVKRAEAPRSIEITVQPLPAAEGERTLVQQVFANLLQNAAKFTRTRDDARIEVGSTTDNGETAYYVRDNGVGFEMRYADKLFGVFQRLHRADEFEGTGVGLAIVQRIVHRHGGRVWAEGALDQGATFYFTLPSEPPLTD